MTISTEDNIRPTLEALNKDNRAVRDQLLLLRILNTSDLSFLFMLYGTSTLQDIAKTAIALKAQDPDHGLTTEEFAEYDSYISDLLTDRG